MPTGRPPANAWTPEQAKAAVKLKRNGPIKLAKMQLKGITRVQQYELMRSVLSNPAVIGTVLYLLVGHLRPSTTTTATGTTTQAPAPSLVQEIIGFLGNWMPIGGIGSIQPGGNAAGVGQDISNIFNGIGIDALQAALLAYIATGGNLAGTLQGGANILSSIKGLIPVAAAAP